MPLTEDDVARLEKLGHARADFIFWNEHGAAQLANVERPDGKKACFFLRDDKCSVYADRPAGCRIYPLVLNEHGKLLRDDECPHRAEFPLDPTAKRRIQRVVSNLARKR